MTIGLTWTTTLTGSSSGTAPGKLPALSRSLRGDEAEASSDVLGLLDAELGGFLGLAQGEGKLVFTGGGCRGVLPDREFALLPLLDEGGLLLEPGVPLEEDERGEEPCWVLLDGPPLARGCELLPAGSVDPEESPRLLFDPAGLRGASLEHGLQVAVDG